MPTRNSRKTYIPDTYYHVYSRGLNKQAIFRDSSDYAFFLNLFERYLSPQPKKKQNGQPAVSFADTLSLLSFCFMPNHIHLLFYQHENEYAMTDLLQRVFTGYSMYFNKKYERSGPLFQSRYLASIINSDEYLHHITRYIHRNPHFWRDYPYSSLSDYTGETARDWIETGSVLELFNNNRTAYLNFITAMDEDDEESVTDELAHE